MLGSSICPRCVAIYLNILDDELFRRPDDEIFEDLSKKWPSLVNKEAIAKRESNDEKECCHSCLGILDDYFIQSCVDMISAQIKNEKYIFKNFKMMISQPVQLIIFANCVNGEYKDLMQDYRRAGRGLEIKDIFKIVVEPLLAESLSSVAVPGAKDSELEITVFLKHNESEIHLLPKLEKAAPKCFSNAKFNYAKISRKRPRNDLTIYTLAAVSQAVNKLKYEGLSKMIEENYFKSSVTLDQIKAIRSPIYLAGRYCKYSRDLSQTPWFLDGERKSELSVQEYIAEPIKKLMQSDSYNFSSSGREDIDVRMLGIGRPFLLEMVNPRTFSEKPGDIKDLQSTINKSTEQIKIRDLQIIAKSEKDNLKDGEEGKTKSYSSICYTMVTESRSKTQLTECILKLSSMKDVVIEQKTPLRVLHRRNLAVRKRTVIEMNAEIIDISNAAKTVSMPESIPEKYIFFKLDMTTQAGTYVKEFVHGDFGRTVPHIGVLIGADADILSLDVTAVNLDWPQVIF